MSATKTPTTVVHYCAACGRRLRNGKWIVGKNKALTGRTPRYCWPGSGCNK